MQATTIKRSSQRHGGYLYGNSGKTKSCRFDRTIRSRRWQENPAYTNASRNVGGGTGGCRESSVGATGATHQDRAAGVRRVSAPTPAKLAPPRLHDVAERERLFSLLDERCQYPLDWISGPPGAGKTTLVASYLPLASRQASDIRSTRATAIRPRCFSTCARCSLPLAKRA